MVAALQARLIEETDVRSLKIRHNGVLGYFVEVPAGHGTKLLEPPHRETFIHRQTLANAMRFTTAELAELEGRIAKAHDAALAIEGAIFTRLSDAVVVEVDRASAPSPMRWPSSMSPPPSPTSAPPAISAGRRSMTASPSTSKAAAIRWSRPMCGAAATCSSRMAAT